MKRPCRRPSKAVIRKAIEDADGNLLRAATVLGCARQSLYTWIYQLGMERVAGVDVDRLDTRARLDSLDRQDRQDRQDGHDNKSDLWIPGNSGVYSTSPDAQTIHLVTTHAAMATEIPVTATVRLPESLWKRVKIAAIRQGVTVGELVQRVLENSFAADDLESRASSKQKSQ